MADKPKPLIEILAKRDADVGLVGLAAAMIEWGEAVNARMGRIDAAIQYQRLELDAVFGRLDSLEEGLLQLIKRLDRHRAEIETLKTRMDTASAEIGHVIEAHDRSLMSKS
jgi:chromosome segregation ATPase